MRSTIAIIPARYNSTRFPGKPLAKIGGKPVIEHVYKHVSQAVSNVVVATDDIRIHDAVTSFGGNSVMTSSKARSGTERCYEAYKLIGSNEDIILNIQGDEPLVRPEDIKKLIEETDFVKYPISTLVRKVTKSESIAIINNPDNVKVTISDSGRILYFSRSIIPYIRGSEIENRSMGTNFYLHIGIYAFAKEILEKIVDLPESSLESAEKLEQLRWLESDYNIKAIESKNIYVGIDRPSDIAEAEKYLSLL